jgi:hypothetical protein
VAYKNRNMRSLAVIEWRRRLKDKAIDYKGGSCTICGYRKCRSALEFHHLDPSHKDFDWSQKGVSRAWSKVVVELDKCAMLCANCHREVHAGSSTVEPLIVNQVVDGSNPSLRASASSKYRNHPDLFSSN